MVAKALMATSKLFTLLAMASGVLGLLSSNVAKADTPQPIFGYCNSICAVLCEVRVSGCEGRCPGDGCDDFDCHCLQVRDCNVCG